MTVVCAVSILATAAMFYTGLSRLGMEVCVGCDQRQRAIRKGMCDGIKPNVLLHTKTGLLDKALQNGLPVKSTSISKHYKGSIT